MIVTDILKVPTSENGNFYLLVVKVYFTKWLDDIPHKDLTADTIFCHLVKIFFVYGLPRILHCDQGPNFESTILRHTCEALGITKSHITPYHPQGNGMVERANHSIIQMLRIYCEQEST